MNLKLRLLLFYINNFAKQIDYSNVDAPTVRKINQAEFKKVSKLIDEPPLPMNKIEDAKIKMRDGAMIPIRIYHPTASKNQPVFVFYHGGGFVTRSIETHDKVCRRLAKMNDMVVVSVGYRLAPEFPFPFPHQDCYDATVWVSAHGKQYNYNAEKMVVGGDSAGGKLATVTTILARDLNGPKISYQVLIYPTTDARLQFPSIDTYGKGYFLTKPLMQWFVNQYIPNKENITNPLASPYLTEDLSNLPPAFVCTAELDPLKDEGAAYAKRLKAAGNPVIFKEYPNVVHGFFNLMKITRKTTTMLFEDIQKALRMIMR
ncbi:MAG: alpha/beta hydrolase [Bacteroidota bacterium]